MILSVVVAAFEKVANVLLAGDPDKDILLQPLSGKALKVWVNDYQFGFTVSIRHGKFHIHQQTWGSGGAEDAGSPGVCQLDGSLAALFAVGLSDDPQRTVGESDVVVIGDVGVLLEMQAFIKRWRFDWAGRLSDVLGATAAGIVSAPIERFLVWHRENKTKFRDDVAEYLVEELVVLPGDLAVKDFYAMLDALQLRLDRVSAKVNLLAESFEKSAS